MSETTYSDYRSGRYDLSQLSVHIPCLGVFGQTEHGYQACACEPSTAWPDCDVSRAVDLCVVCARGTAGGPSRWAWLGCACCRAVELELRDWFGIMVLPLARHSIMNGVSQRIAPRESDGDGAFALSLNNLGLSQDRLRAWGLEEGRNLAQHLVGEPDEVALPAWLEQFPVSPERSLAAYERLLAIPLPPTLPDLVERRLAQEAAEADV